MPKRVYDSFLLKETRTKPRKLGQGERPYAIFTCPHCGGEVDVPHEGVSNQKGNACKAHLAVCPSYSPPAPKENEVAELLREQAAKHAEEREEDRRKHEAEKQESKRRHEELMAQLSHKRQCLTDVREWGSLKEPDNTLVPQLTYRETVLVASHEAEASRLRAENEVLRASLKDKAPASLITRAAEAEATAERVKRDYKARMEALEMKELTTIEEQEQLRRHKRRLQALVHPDKAPATATAKEWATKVFQNMFKKG